MKFKPLTEADVEFTIECLPEDVPVRGNAMASGDPEVDKETEDYILDQLERGNEWAWCCVRVAAHWENFHGDDYLWGCSYASEEEFCQPGGYFEHMKRAALDDLNTQIESTAAQWDA